MSPTHCPDPAALEDLLDQLVGEFADRVLRGERPDRAPLLGAVPPDRRAALERCLDRIDGLGAAAVAVPRALGPGEQLGDFRIVSLLGRGGMAYVYEAEQRGLERRVALKVMRPGLALEPRHVDRFRREASAVARLAHPNVVQVHAVGATDGHHWIAMERVAGPSLADVLRRLSASGRTAAALAAAAGAPALAWSGATFEQAVASLLSGAARGVAAAHRAGVVHRDVKPSNVLIHADGRASVADFGLAKGDSDPSLSLSGEPLGTPHYMAPEQILAAAVDARADVYSLGVTLYECLSGRRPYQGATALEVFDAIRGAAPPPLGSVADVSADAEAVVERAMARDPARRYASAADLADDLSALAAGRATRARAERPAGAARALAVAAALLRPGPFEYRSRARLFGLPLVHVRKRAPGERRRLPPVTAWLAVGSTAVGVVAIGGAACGVVALGVVCAGAVAIGGVAALGLALALAGTLAAGTYAIGGGAVGIEAAVGGLAAGRHVLAGKAYAAHAIDGADVDPVAAAWFQRHCPAALGLLPEPARARIAAAALLAEEDAAAAAPAARPRAGTWTTIDLDNGVRALIAHLPDAPHEACFAFLPHGLLADGPGRTQWAHLAEHALIRGVDPGALEVDGLLVNGETGAASLRLEALCRDASPRTALDHVARWLATRRLDGAALGAERLRILGEVDSTCAGGYSAKWAAAAWNQVYRHGASHVQVRGAIAAATPEDLESYLATELPHGAAEVLAVCVGPAAPDDLRPALEATLGALPLAAAMPPHGVERLERGDRAATWDLDVAHVLVACPLEADSIGSRAAALVVALLVQQAAAAEPALRPDQNPFVASAEFLVPEGRFLTASAGVRKPADAAAVRAAIERTLERAAATAPDQALPLLRNAGLATADVPDFAALRSRMRGQPGADFIEAQWALNEVNLMILLGASSPAEAQAALARVDTADVAAVAERLREPHRFALLLEP